MPRATLRPKRPRWTEASTAPRSSTAHRTGRSIPATPAMQRPTALPTPKTRPWTSLVPVGQVGSPAARPLRLPLRRDVLLEDAGREVRKDAVGHAQPA